MRPSDSTPFLAPWPLLGLAVLLVVLIAVSAALWAGTTPAGAQDGYQPDPDLIEDVWEYARELNHGPDHVLRWMRVLKTLGAIKDMSAAQAQEYADRYLADRWDPVVAELERLEAAPGDYQPDREVVEDVEDYAKETGHGFDHVLRWIRVLKTLGAVEDMSAAKAQEYADRYSAERWDPVVEELRKKEAATPPNRAPVVNEQGKRYHEFTGMNNAPRGILVSKPFHGVFTDPDGDELTYTVSVPDQHRQLVEELVVTLDRDYRASGGSRKPMGLYDRVWFRLEGEADWKAVRPALPYPLITTATLTATDPEGLSASVRGDFRTHWVSYPEVVRAVASEQAIALTFDLELQGDPAPGPGQFTVNVANADGTKRTVEVSNVAVNGKVVTLELGAALAEGQTVTVDYAYDHLDDGHVALQRAGGGDYARSFSGQAVAWPLPEPPGVPANFAVSVTLGSLDVRARWDEVAGATSYRLRWREAGGEFEAANAISVEETSATITVSAYGEWEVQLQACNDAGCAPEAGTPEEDVPSAQLSLAPAREDQSESEGEGQGQGRSRSMSAPASSDPVEDAASYTVGWRRDGTDPQAPALSQPDDAQQPQGGPSGDGVQGSSDPTDTTPPRLERGEIDGDTMTFYFSEPLDEDAVGSQFRVLLGWGSSWCSFTAHPRKVEVSGNQVVVHGLTNRGWPGWYRVGVGDRVRAYYYKDDRAFPASERLQDLNGNEVSTPNRSPWAGRFRRAREPLNWINLTAPPLRSRAPRRIPTG